MPSSRESSQPRDPTRVSCIAGRFFTAEPLRKPSVAHSKCSISSGQINGIGQPCFELLQAGEQSGTCNAPSLWSGLGDPTAGSPEKAALKLSPGQAHHGLGLGSGGWGQSGHPEGLPPVAGGGHGPRTPGADVGDTHTPRRRREALPAEQCPETRAGQAGLAEWPGHRCGAGV